MPIPYRLCNNWYDVSGWASGLMNDSNLASRYSAEKASRVNPAMPTAPRLANIHHGAPAKNSTAMKTMVSATVVPRSG